jgi:NAD(P)-dependent dehydrogenase (short-subunit alcohol dehydrogenase family)
MLGSMSANTLFDLSGRIAVVTGAGRGLGRALAFGLADAGARVVACDVNAESARGTASAIGRGSLGRPCDVTKPEEIETLLGELTTGESGPEIWVNNAGIDVIEPTLDASLANWNRILDVNLTGGFLGSQRAARVMAKRGRGSIINITSLAASAGIRNLGAYSAAKAGLAQLTRVMALELAPAGVRVNAIAPGYLENVMVGAEAEHANPDKEAQIKLFTPMGRRARLDELVGPVVFLASDAASYVTGAILAVDGGYTAI